MQACAMLLRMISPHYILSICGERSNDRLGLNKLIEFWNVAILKICSILYSIELVSIKNMNEIYNEITTGAVYTLKESDLTFLRSYNGLLLSISKLLKMNIKLHCLDNCQYISKLYSVNEDKGRFHCLQCDNKNQKQFFTFVDKNQKVTYCRRCINFGRSDDS